MNNAHTISHRGMWVLCLFVKIEFQIDHVLEDVLCSGLSFLIKILHKVHHVLHTMLLHLQHLLEDHLTFDLFLVQHLHKLLMPLPQLMASVNCSLETWDLASGIFIPK